MLATLGLMCVCAAAAHTLSHAPMRCLQMVALNYQTPSKALALNEALFELNARCEDLRPSMRPAI